MFINESITVVEILAFSSFSLLVQLNLESSNL